MYSGILHSTCYSHLNKKVVDVINDNNGLTYIMGGAIYLQ